MATLPSTTISRLLKLPQSDAVWEGDRRSLNEFDEQDTDQDRDCIIWVDASEESVRVMEMVSSETGMEAMIRTLLRAMETPQGSGKPSRPKRIVVRDREIQFFLRGLLQPLEITVEHVRELPVIDTVFENLRESSQQRPSLLPPNYEQPLLQTAQEIWENAPWENLADSEIITIDLLDENLDPLYLSVMGMLGAEYGILLYRSLESLKNFRSQIMQGDSMEDLEQVFMQQDCWFLNYEVGEEDEEAIEDASFVDVEPYFGSINPYEGLRPFLGEEEAKVVYVSLQALQQFISDHQWELETQQSQPLEQQYVIPLPETVDASTQLSVKVSNNPDLEEELMDLQETEDSEEETEVSSPIREDLVPQDSFLSIGMMPWDVIQQMQNNPKVVVDQSVGISQQGEGLPVVLIQTTRPKGKELIENIQALGGLQGIAFSTGEDPETDTAYDLGMLQTGNGELYLFGEFQQDDPTHVKARQKWDQRSQQTEGYCGLIIARGLKGASRGQPQMRDMMALFEAKALSQQDLGLGVLQLMEW